MPNNYLSVLYKHIIQVENENVGLKVCVCVWGGGGGGINIPFPPPNHKRGGHMPPPPSPASYASVYIYIKEVKPTAVLDVAVLPPHTAVGRIAPRFGRVGRGPAVVVRVKPVREVPRFVRVLVRDL